VATKDVFESSDSVRHSKPLRYAQYFTLSNPLLLEKGGRLPSVTVAYETYGRLNPARDNAILQRRVDPGTIRRAVAIEAAIAQSQPRSIQPHATPVTDARRDRILIRDRARVATGDRETRQRRIVGG
jgi:hypothetical protein